MAAHVNLPTAAAASYGDLNTLWLAGTLKAALTSFWQGILITFGDQFPEQQANSHPVSNWLAVIASLAQNMPNANVPYNDFIAAVQDVYRLCWMTQQLLNQNLITAAQATTGAGSVLVQYNANF